jgi:zinc protease
VDPSYLGRFIQDMYAVTPSAIHMIAGRYLTPDRMVLVVVGDRKALAPQLEEIGLVVD